LSQFVSATLLLFLLLVADVLGRVFTKNVISDDANRLVLQYLLAGFAALGLYLLLKPRELVVERKQRLDLAFYTKPKWLLMGGVVIGFTRAAATLLIVLLLGYVARGTVTVEGVCISVAVAFGTAAMEEVIFRGVFLELLVQRIGSFKAIFFVAILFTLAHIDIRSWTGLLSIFIGGGFAYCLAYLIFRSIWLPLGMHIGSNIVTLFIGGVPNINNGWIAVNSPLTTANLVDLCTHTFLLLALLFVYQMRTQELIDGTSCDANADDPEINDEDARL
jgi:uncharacterized protein